MGIDGDFDQAFADGLLNGDFVLQIFAVSLATTRDIAFFG